MCSTGILLDVQSSLLDFFPGPKWILFLGSCYRSLLNIALGSCYTLIISPDLVTFLDRKYTSWTHQSANDIPSAFSSLWLDVLQLIGLNVLKLPVLCTVFQLLVCLYSSSRFLCIRAASFLYSGCFLCIKLKVSTVYWKFFIIWAVWVSRYSSSDLGYIRTLVISYAHSSGWFLECVFHWWCLFIPTTVIFLIESETNTSDPQKPAVKNVYIYTGTSSLVSVDHRCWCVLQYSTADAFNVFQRLVSTYTKCWLLSRFCRPSQLLFRLVHSRTPTVFSFWFDLLSAGGGWGGVL
jgi:hypothetical protein